ncbi:MULTISPECIES: effector-associated domain EAD1-containing protein [Frankia]|uniref:effector-associated domain EAD1-containing protein n=1 Tax=Frankia TaxID=1854 RepID=UPI0005A50CFC|nr:MULTISPECIES: effector-associated domain EAD1-containing protein [Frankia]
MAAFAIVRLQLPRRPDGLVVVLAALLGAVVGVPVALLLGAGPEEPSILLPEAAVALIFSSVACLRLSAQPGRRTTPGKPPPRRKERSRIMTESRGPLEIDWARVEQLTGPEQGELSKILCTVFPRRSDFARFLRHRLDRVLDNYVGDAVGMEAAVFTVVEQAQAAGWLAPLAAKAYAERANNPLMRAWAEKYRSGAPATAGGTLPAGRGSARLTTDQQIKAVAQAFHNPTLADGVLARAGLPRERRPPWQEDLTPEHYWQLIHDRIILGAAKDVTWRRVLEAAHENLPGNPNFEV